MLCLLANTRGIFIIACYQQLRFGPRLKRVAALNTKPEEYTETSVNVHQYTQHCITEVLYYNSSWSLKFYNTFLSNEKSITILFFQQQQ